MPSRIEAERQSILEQLNNQGRILEQRSPAAAAELNANLRKVVDWLVARLTQSSDPRELKRK